MSSISFWIDRASDLGLLERRGPSRAAPDAPCARPSEWTYRANYTGAVHDCLHPHDDSHAYRFCPRCGGPLERRLLKATEPERLVCTRCGFVFYLDPKIAVGTIIRDAIGRLVLVRRAIEPGYGKWVFPGGYVDRGEPLHGRGASAKRARNAASTSGSTASSTSTRTPAARRSSSSTRPRRCRRHACSTTTKAWKPRSSRTAAFRGTSSRSAARATGCATTCRACGTRCRPSP